MAPQQRFAGPINSSPLRHMSIDTVSSDDITCEARPGPNTLTTFFTIFPTDDNRNGARSVQTIDADPDTHTTSIDTVRTGDITDEAHLGQTIHAVPETHNKSTDLVSTSKTTEEETPRKCPSKSLREASIIDDAVLGSLKPHPIILKPRRVSECFQQDNSDRDKLVLTQYSQFLYTVNKLKASKGDTVAILQDKLFEVQTSKNALHKTLNEANHRLRDVQYKEGILREKLTEVEHDRNRLVTECNVYFTIVGELKDKLQQLETDLERAEAHRRDTKRMLSQKAQELHQVRHQLAAFEQVERGNASARFQAVDWVAYESGWTVEMESFAAAEKTRRTQERAERLNKRRELAAKRENYCKSLGVDLWAVRFTRGALMGSGYA